MKSVSGVLSWCSPCKRFELLSAEMEKQAVASELDIGDPIASTVVDAASVCGLDAVLHCQRKTPATKLQPAELSKPNYHAYWTMLSGWNGPNNISNSIDSVHWNLLVLGLLAHTALSFLYSLHRHRSSCVSDVLSTLGVKLPGSVSCCLASSRFSSSFSRPSRLTFQVKEIHYRTLGPKV